GGGGPGGGGGGGGGGRGCAAGGLGGGGHGRGRRGRDAHRNANGTSNHTCLPGPTLVVPHVAENRSTRSSPRPVSAVGSTEVTFGSSGESSSTATRTCWSETTSSTSGADSPWTMAWVTTSLVNSSTISMVGAGMLRASRISRTRRRATAIDLGVGSKRQRY